MGRLLCLFFVCLLSVLTFSTSPQCTESRSLTGLRSRVAECDVCVQFPPSTRRGRCSIVQTGIPWPKKKFVKRTSWQRLVGRSQKRSAMARFTALLLLPLLVELASTISFFLPVNSRKCLREEIHKDVLVTGEYEISEQANTKTNLKITDSASHLLYSKDDATKGKFAFTTEDYEMFEVCFESKSPMGTGRVPDQLVNLDMKHGVEAKNYEEIAKVEKLKPLEVELRRLEDLSESIVNDFAYMKKREEEMRDTNESTNTRVLYFSVFSMCCLIGLATWQVFYLRRFFKAKKLIE